MIKKIIIFSWIVCGFFACQKININKKEASSGLDNVEETSSISAVPDSAHADLRNHFSKYINIIANNGLPIHVLAQSGVSNNKIYKVVDVLKFYLQNYPSAYGTEKSEITNKMAANKATLYLFDDERRGEKAIIKTKSINLNYQVIYADEIIVDGSQEYINNTFRDATFEQVLHLVQEYGIAEIIPEYQIQIRAAAEAAIAKGYWISVMIPEWEKEGNIAAQYLATILDVYYGFWQNSANDIAFNGEYFFSSREALRLGDPDGYKLINEQFLPPFLDYEVSIHSDFNGQFRMEYDTASRYTTKSQYLSDIRLTGNNNASIKQNSYNNYLIGNSGDNKVYYNGSWENYSITLGNPAVIIDLIEGRDGSDTLESIEFIVFADTIISN